MASWENAFNCTYLLLAGTIVRCMRKIKSEQKYVIKNSHILLCSLAENSKKNGCLSSSRTFFLSPGLASAQLAPHSPAIDFEELVTWLRLTATRRGASVFDELLQKAVESDDVRVSQFAIRLGMYVGEAALGSMCEGKPSNQLR